MASIGDCIIIYKVRYDTLSEILHILVKVPLSPRLVKVDPPCHFGGERGEPWQTHDYSLQATILQWSQVVVLGPAHSLVEVIVDFVLELFSVSKVINGSCLPCASDCFGGCLDGAASSLLAVARWGNPWGNTLFGSWDSDLVCSERSIWGAVRLDHISSSFVNTWLYGCSCWDDVVEMDTYLLHTINSSLWIQLVFFSIFWHSYSLFVIF